METREQLNNPHGVSCYMIVENDAGEWLFVRRSKVGYGEGQLGLLGGHLDPEETFAEGACREANEEAGIEIDPSDAEFVHMAHRHKGGEIHRGRVLEPRVDTYFRSTKWDGDPENMEPEKHSDIEWHNPDTLDPHEVVDFIYDAIQAIRRHRAYSEFGPWPSTEATSVEE